MSEKIELHVEHCVKCQGYGPKFLKTYKIKVLSNPQKEEPRKETFEVFFNGKLVFSKLKFARFPTESDYLDIYLQTKGQKSTLSSELDKIDVIKEITEEEMKKLEKDSFVIVDVRDKSSGYYDQTIEGAHRMNMNKLLLDAVHGDIEKWKEKKMILFCDCGFLAKICVEKLNSMGFDSYNLYGGLFKSIGKDDWATCCLPTKIKE